MRVKPRLHYSFLHINVLIKVKMRGWLNMLRAAQGRNRGGGQGGRTRKTSPSPSLLSTPVLLGFWAQSGICLLVGTIPTLYHLDSAGVWWAVSKSCTLAIQPPWCQGLQTHCVIGTQGSNIMDRACLLSRSLQTPGRGTSRIWALQGQGVLSVLFIDKPPEPGIMPGR